MPKVKITVRMPYAKTKATKKQKKKRKGSY
jgi:hypothetical protein